MKYLKHKHIDMKNYTETSIVEKTEILEDTEKSKKLVIYNDEVNTFEHVIECLMNYCKHEPQQAEQCALIIHNRGKCSVKEGDLDKLKPLKEALCENYIDAKIE